MDFNAGSSVGRRWAKLLAASGQLHGRHWAGSHGRRQRSSTTRRRAVTGTRSPTGSRTSTGRRPRTSRSASSSCGGTSGWEATARIESLKPWLPPVLAVRHGTGSARFSASLARRPGSATGPRSTKPRLSADSRRPDCRHPPQNAPVVILVNRGSTTTTSSKVSIEPGRLRLCGLGPQVGAYLVLAQAPNREGDRVPDSGAQFSCELLELPMGGDIDPNPRARHVDQLRVNMTATRIRRIRLRGCWRSPRRFAGWTHRNRLGSWP